MADRVKYKEPGEIVDVNIPFDDVMEGYEDVDSVDVKPYKLTGANPRSYQYDIGDTHELVIEKTLGGKPSEIDSLDVANDVKAVLQVFETEDPVDAPEIFHSVDPMQKSVDVTLEAGQDQIDYLLQVNVVSTTDMKYSKELKVKVRAE